MSFNIYILFFSFKNTTLCNVNSQVEIPLTPLHSFSQILYLYFSISDLPACTYYYDWHAG